MLLMYDCEGGAMSALKFLTSYKKIRVSFINCHLGIMRLHRHKYAGKANGVQSRRGRNIFGSTHNNSVDS
jgi:hypothetical protein